MKLDLFLNADSLTKLAKLAIVTKRPMVVMACVAWLLINLVSSRYWDSATHTDKGPASTSRNCDAFSDLRFQCGLQCSTVRAWQCFDSKPGPLLSSSQCR